MAATTTDGDAIEVRIQRWPGRPTHATRVHRLGEDRYGVWLGVRVGAPWWARDGSRAGVHRRTIVKVVPRGAYWTACFALADPVVDVDIVLPARWRGAIVEETDLELDVLRAADGRVWVRDADEFARLCADFALPDALAERALATCADLRARLTAHTEPFGTVGPGWLARFLAADEETHR
jgi:hypothetical protein